MVDVVLEIQVFYWFVGFFVEQFVEQVGFGVVGGDQVIVEVLQMFYGICLCGIVEEIGVLEIGLVVFEGCYDWQ